MALKIQKREQPDSGGVWVNIAEDGDNYRWWLDADRKEGVVKSDPEGRLKVVPWGSRMRHTIRTLHRKYQRFRRGGDLPQDVQDRLLFEALAKSALEDWEDIRVDDGANDYTPELGIRAMEADPEFGDLVAEISRALARDLAEQLAEDAETLGNGSGGGSSGDPAATPRG